MTNSALTNKANMYKNSMLTHRDRIDKLYKGWDKIYVRKNRQTGNIKFFKTHATADNDSDKL